jgi:hypothetical protein
MGRMAFKEMDYADEAQVTVLNTALISYLKARQTIWILATPLGASQSLLPFLSRFHPPTAHLLDQAGRFQDAFKDNLWHVARLVLGLVVARPMRGESYARGHTSSNTSTSRSNHPLEPPA